MALTESLRIDWSSLRAAGSAAEVPAAIERLRDARTFESATRAYREIDNTVVVQGSLYEAAEYVVPCLLSVLPDCTRVARPTLLYLLYVLGNGGPSDIEFAAGNRQIDERCHAAVKLGVSQYFYFLEKGSSDESGRCADLIELCSRTDPAIGARGRWWIGRMLEAVPEPKLKKVYQDSLTRMNEFEAAPW